MNIFEIKTNLYVRNIINQKEINKNENNKERVIKKLIKEKFDNKTEPIRIYKEILNIYA